MPKRVRVLEQRAEAVDAHDAHRVRRLQVGDERDQSRHPLVLGRILSRQAPQVVPDHLDTQLARPLEQLHALQAGGALAHQLEHRRAEVLHAGLQPAHARPRPAGAADPCSGRAAPPDRGPGGRGRVPAPAGRSRGRRAARRSRRSRSRATRDGGERAPRAPSGCARRSCADTSDCRSPGRRRRSDASRPTSSRVRSRTADGA